LGYQIETLNVAIVGACGFIGRHLRRLIEGRMGVQLQVWNRSSHGNFLSRDDREAFIGTEPELVFQCAWTTIENTNYRFDESNYSFAEANLDFVRSCSSRGIKTVSLGTNVPHGPMSTQPYFKSKEILEQGIVAESSGIAKLVKPTFVFSFTEGRPHICRQVSEWIRQGKSITDFVLHDPSGLHDFIEVRDVAEGLFKIAFQQSSTTSIVLRSGTSLRLKDFVHIFAKKFKEEDPPYVPYIFDYSDDLLDSQTWCENTFTNYELRPEMRET